MDNACQKILINFVFMKKTTANKAYLRKMLIMKLPLSLIHFWNWTLSHEIKSRFKMSDKAKCCFYEIQLAGVNAAVT